MSSSLVIGLTTVGLSQVFQKVSISYYFHYQIGLGYL